AVGCYTGWMTLLRLFCLECAKETLHIHGVHERNLDLLEDGQRWAQAIGLVVALIFGLSRIFWSQAVIAEVYSLNALFVALMLLFTLWATRDFSAGSWPISCQGLVAGLALGNHVTIGLPVAVWLAAVLIRMPVASRAGRLARALLGIAAGLLINIYLPLRAAAHPPINWGEPRDWTGFWWAISGQPYRSLAFGLPPSLLSGRAAAWAALLIQQFGWVGVGLGFVGLIYGATGARLFVWLSAGIAVVYSVFALAYNTADSYAYLVPVYLIFAIWIGLGIERALHTIERYHTLSLQFVMMLMFAMVFAWQVPATARLVDASQDRHAIDYAANVLKSAPAHAIIMTASGRDTFPLWYDQYALGSRPDLVIIVEPLLDFKWYHDTLRRTYPALSLPARAETSWLETIMAANGGPGRMCRTNPQGDPQLECEMQGIQP
ncbi:MAG: DUF2723 domain-containing protein, partial [Chloroflexota bacterium]|nr:DUF2723 domain-containing protein [Chloroflexota bacterium]